MIVFRIGDGRPEGLGNDACRLARNVLENSQCLLRRKPLHLTHDFAHLLRGHAEILGNGLDLHDVSLFGFRLRGVGSVLLEGPSEAELAQLVADHVLSHKDCIEHLAVVNIERHSNEFRGDRRPPGPRLDRSTCLGILRLVDPALEAGINVRTLFE